MKRVFIAHPLRGDLVANIQNVQRIMRQITMEQPDVLPVAPYVTACSFLDDEDPAERAMGIQQNNEYLKSGFIDELWVCGSHISAGVAAEIALANQLNIPVKMMGNWGI